MAFEDLDAKQRARFSEREKLRETLFQRLVAGEISKSFVEAFEDALYDAGMEKHEDIAREKESFVSAFSKLSESQKAQMLAVPSELRRRLFSTYAAEVISGKIDTSNLPELLVKRNEASGNTIGYHLSPVDIKEPSKEGAPWIIKGSGSHAWMRGEEEKGSFVVDTEKGDEGSPYAFYSFDYTGRYLKKPMQYLYVVIGTKKGEGHHLSNNGKWGHALQLDVVQQIDMLALEKELDEQMKKLESANKE